MNERKKAVVKFAASLTLLLIAYIPTFKWMFERWTAPESYYGHGFLIPIVSLYIIWQRRELLRKAALSNNMAGLAIVAVGLLVHIICALLNVYFISGFSFVFVLYGLILFSFGKETTRSLIFPVFFLFAMVPLPLIAIGNATVKLKLFAAQCATVILNRIGFPSILDGSTIRMPNSFTIVGAPCSGLRSLISLITLGLLFAYALKVPYFKKGLLLLSSIPIAIISNITRIVLLAGVNDLYGEKAATGFFHNFSGFLVFAIAFIGLFGITKALETDRD